MATPIEQRNRPLGQDGKPPQEDIRKCGEEIKQLRNQQLILGTTGLGLFGVYSTLLPRLTTAIDQPELYIWTGIAMLSVFAFLFLWALRLRVLIGIISTWLELVGKSTWEHDFRAYHKKYPRVSQTGWLSATFFVLGIGVGGLVYLFSRSSKGTLQDWQAGIFLGVIIPYLLVVAIYGFWKEGIDDEDFRTEWLGAVPALTKEATQQSSGTT